MRKQIGIVLLALVAVGAIGVYLNSAPTLVSDGTDFSVEIHVSMWHYRDGILLDYSHHAGVLTTLGANWIEDQMGDSPATDPAKWIAVSNDATSPQASWETIPAEIVTNGLSRAPGTYASTGDGTWTITKSFSVTGTQSCQLTGLYWAVSGDFLLCADTFTQVNAEDGDTLEIEWSLSVT